MKTVEGGLPANIHALVCASVAVQRLPPEILVTIFSLVLQGAALGPSHYWERVADVRQLCSLSAVCRTWKEVAIGTSSLWSTVLVCYAPSQDDLWYKTFPVLPSSPRLSMIRLILCDFFPATVFSALTHLYVRQCSAYLGPLLDLISNSAHLQVLKLYLNGPDILWFDYETLVSGNTHARVNLARLRVLEVVDYLPTLQLNDSAVRLDVRHTIWSNILSAFSFPRACSVRVGAISSQHLALYRRPTRDTRVRREALGARARLLSTRPKSYRAPRHRHRRPVPKFASRAQPLVEPIHNVQRVRRLWLDMRLSEMLPVLIHLPTVEFLALFPTDDALLHVPCAELLGKWRELDADSLAGCMAVPLCPKLTTLALDYRGETCSPGALGAGGEVLSAMGQVVETRAAAGTPRARLLLCVDEDREQEGRVVPALREYDEEGRLIGTDDSEEPTKILERLWSEGVDWKSAEGEWSRSFTRA